MRLQADPPGDPGQGDGREAGRGGGSQLSEGRCEQGSHQSPEDTSQDVRTKCKQPSGCTWPCCCVPLWMAALDRGKLQPCLKPNTWLEAAHPPTAAVQGVTLEKWSRGGAGSWAQRGQGGVRRGRCIPHTVMLTRIAGKAGKVLRPTTLEMHSSCRCPQTAPQPDSSPERFPSHKVPQGSPTSAGACFPSSVPGSTPATANNGTAESVSPPNNTLLFCPLNGSVGLRAAPLRRNAVSS